MRSAAKSKHNDIISDAANADLLAKANARLKKWFAKQEKLEQAGWVHSMCLTCFRKRWPHGKYSSWQTPPGFRHWEVCCFCLKKHKDGIRKTRDPLNRELRCGGIHSSKRVQ
jgi:hypothetical protein